MKSKGLRILDKKNNEFIVEFHDILKEINNGDLFYWSVLNLSATPLIKDEETVNELEKQIDNSKNGIFFTWQELNLLSNKIFQVIDGTFIGCKNIEQLHRYTIDQEMYESCDIVIVMFDSSYWEIFTKDEDLYKRLATRFEVAEFLETDFQDKFNNG